MTAGPLADSIPTTRLYKEATIAWILSRSLFLLIFYLTISSNVSVSTFNDLTLRHPTVSSASLADIETLIRSMTIGDSGWYLGIAENGYSEEEFSANSQKNWAFFPLWPICMKISSLLIDDTRIAGIVLANIFFLTSLLLVVKLGETLSLQTATIRGAIWLLAFSPVSYFFSLPLTESLFLLLGLIATLFVLKNNLISSALIMALATATRPTGAILLPAYYSLLLQQKTKLTLRSFLAMIIAPLGLLAYMAYLHSITGNSFAFSDIQAAWGRTTELALLPTSLHLLIADWNLNILNIPASLLTVFCSLILAKKGYYAAALALFLPIFITLLSGSFQSVARHTIVLFPIYFLIGSTFKNTTAATIIIATLSTLFGAMSLLAGLQVTSALT